ncbi:MAG: glycosyltransferase, partial [Oscillospiraceae bacterium]|nr:glycosyltransferase [Oscillospiraceae bacterium]
MKTLVIIPCYNESENIVRVIGNLKKHAPQVDYLIVNDCSTD